MCGILMYHNGHKLQGCDTFLDFEGLEENTVENVQTKLNGLKSIDSILYKNLNMLYKEVQTTQVLKR